MRTVWLVYMMLSVLTSWLEIISTVGKKCFLVLINYKKRKCVVIRVEFGNLHHKNPYYEKKRGYLAYYESCLFRSLGLFVLSNTMKRVQSWVILEELTGWSIVELICSSNCDILFQFHWIWGTHAFSYLIEVINRM